MGLNLSQAVIKCAHVADGVSIKNRRAHLNSVGNWCGHIPGQPRFFRPNASHKNRPDVIQWARKNLERFYQKPKKWLKALNLSRQSVRQERTEGRERDASVLGVLLHYTELASLRVGIPKENGQFISLNMKFLAKKLGWRTEDDDKLDRQRIAAGRTPLNRGVKRVWRSIQSLKAAGYITVHKRFERALEGEQDYIGLPAVRCMKPKLFWELGINGTKLRTKRDQATKRLKKRYRQYIEKVETKLTKDTTRYAQNILDFTQKLTGEKLSNSSHKVANQWNTQMSAVKEKQRQAHCYELRQLAENRNLSATEFYAKYPELQHPEWKQPE